MKVSKHDPIGTNGDDTIYGDYNVANSISGLDGNNYLQGGLKGDTIDGGAGNDTLVGYSGADTLIGGAGDDTFLYGGWYQSPVATPDLINGFEAPEKIDLKAVFHETVAGDPNSFVPLTMSDITVTDTDATHHHINVNVVAGDPSFDMGIDVIGVAPTAANFILT